MKMYLVTMSRSSLFLFAAGAIFTFAGCKKNYSSRSLGDSKLTFVYNSKEYSLPYSDWWFMDGGITINRPDIFNGTIVYPTSYCGYLIPTDSTIENNGNCQLSSWGMPIDSVAVYIYQSGTLNITYSNFHSVSGFNIITGGNGTVNLCDVNGKFNLTLKNKNGNTISITEGKLEIYEYQR